MVKSKKDFSNEELYKDYAKTGEFLFSYSWKGKSEDEIIEDMALNNVERTFLKEGMEKLGAANDFVGMSLDRFILRKIDESVEDDFDETDVVFIERDD